MHKTDKKIVRDKIKGRALTIYLDLCRQVDQLPPGGLLPSMRKLQRQYTASQQTISTALKHLAATRPLLRQPRRRARLSPAIETHSEQMHCKPQHTTVTTLGLSGSIAATWQPIIDFFNEKNKRIIKPHYVKNLPELIKLSQHGQIDFSLFHCNPVMNGVLGSTLSFINLKDLVKTIKINDFYPGLLMTDPQNRHWGISAVLSSSIILANRRFGHIPCKDFSWDELLPYFRKCKNNYSKLLYPFMFNGYSIFLMNNGVTMVDRNTGKIKFDKEKFANSLHSLKTVLDEALAPLFSDTHYDLASLQWLGDGKIAAREIFHSSLKQFMTFGPDVDLLPMPAAPGVKRTMFSEFFSICASSINYGTAWDFIKFVLSTPIQKLLIESNTVMPVRRHLRPSHLSPEQFEVFAEVLEKSCSQPEDYYLPVQLRLLIETGVDRWNKFGGDIDDFLDDLEKSCQQQLRHWEVYSG